MKKEIDPFNYDDLMAVFDVLTHPTGMKTMINLVHMLGDVVTEEKLKRMLRYWGRKHKVACKGRGDEATFQLVGAGERDAILEQKRSRSAERWSGDWSIVTYDVPVSHNTVRIRLVRALHDMGFAMLSASSWISPYDWSDVFTKMLSGWNCGGVISYIRSAQVRPLVGGSDSYPVSLWNIDEIARQYGTLARRCGNAPKTATVQARTSRARTALWGTKQLALLEKQDPMLPAALLPAGWPREKARRSLAQLRAKVAAEAADTI